MEKVSYTVDEIADVLNSLIIAPRVAKLIISEFKNKKYAPMIDRIRELYNYIKKGNIKKCTGGLAYLFYLLDTNAHNLIDFDPEKIIELLNKFPSEVYNHNVLTFNNWEEVNITWYDMPYISKTILVYPLTIDNPIKYYDKLKVIIGNIDTMDNILFGIKR